MAGETIFVLLVTMWPRSTRVSFVLTSCRIDSVHTKWCFNQQIVSHPPLWVVIFLFFTVVDNIEYFAVTAVFFNILVSIHL